MNRAILVPTLLLLVLALGGAALADTLYLKNGNKFEGKLIRETSTHYYFKIRGMGEQPFKKSDVLKIEKGESTYDVYEKKRKALKADDAQGWYELGVWCEENKMRKEARKAWRAAIKADPDHADARDKLGYVRYEGEWITKKKRDEILAEIAKREGATVAAMKTGEPYSDRAARIRILPPKDWEADTVEGSSATWTGPDLGEVPVVIDITVDETDDDLAEFAKSVEESLKGVHEDAKRMGEPLAAKLAGFDAKHLTFQYAEDDVAMEHHVLAMKCGAGGVRLSLTCRDGYFTMLKPFFDKIAGSLKILEKPLDVEVREGGYAFGMSYPDNGYRHQAGIPISDRAGNSPPVPKGTVSIVVKANPMAFILVVPGTEGDGTADATSLETLRDSIPKTVPLGLQIQGTGTSRKVAGQDALYGNYVIRGGQLGKGFYCVFKHGKQFFRLVIVNLLNQMGENYVKTDFDKLLDSFRFLD